MSSDALPPRAQEALEAVGAFLSTLLGGDVRLTAEAGAATGAATAGRLILVGTSETGEALFAVALDEAWVPVLSEAMLGETIPASEASDLLQELAGQAYGAFRAQAGASGPTPPTVLFAVADASPALSEPLSAITFAWSREAGPLAGAVLLPSRVLQPVMASPQAPAPAAPSAPKASAAPAPPVEVARAAFDDFGGEHFVGGDGGSGNLDVLSDVELEVTVELGRRRIPLADVLRLTTGSVIELEKLVGQPLEVYANGRLIAEGEAVVIDEQFGVRVTSLASRRKQQKAFL